MINPFEFEWHKEELPDVNSVSKNCAILYLTYNQDHVISSQVLSPYKMPGSGQLEWADKMACGQEWGGDAHYWTYLNEG